MQASPGQLVHSEACERNKEPIRQVLAKVLTSSLEVLEVGSGTGQHVVYFAGCFPQTEWQPTDTGDYLPGLAARLAAEAPANVRPALDLDVRMNPWPVVTYDVVFSANTLHFMAHDCVVEFFRGAGEALRPGGTLVVYGPFNYAGRYTSVSNARFDEWLRASAPDRSLKDFEWVDRLAVAAGFELQRDVSMPANNRALVWALKPGP